MTESNSVQKKWWVYVNNKKLDEPITIDGVKKFCTRFEKLNFDLFENLLIKGVCLRFPEVKIRLKKAFIFNKQKNNQLNNFM